MKGLAYLDNDNFKVLWYGFDSSVIFNKKTEKQEFVSNSQYGIPRRKRHTYKKTKTYYL